MDKVNQIIKELDRSANECDECGEIADKIYVTDSKYRFGICHRCLGEMANGTLERRNSKRTK